MSTVGQVRDGLAARLATIPGLRVHATLPGQVNPPAAVVRRAETRYGHPFTSGPAAGAYNVILFVAFGDDSAQRALDAYLDDTGPTSVRAAVDADPTLGGTVTSCHVLSAGPDALVEYGGIQYLSATLTVITGDTPAGSGSLASP